MSVLHVWARLRVPRRPPAGLPPGVRESAALRPRLPSCRPLSMRDTSSPTCAQGYTILQEGGGPGDGGVDVVAQLGSDDPVAVQCKAWAHETVCRMPSSDGRSAWTPTPDRTCTFRHGLFGVRYSRLPAPTCPRPRLAAKLAVELADAQTLIPIVSRWMRELRRDPVPFRRRCLCRGGNATRTRAKKSTGRRGKKTSCAASDPFRPERGAKGSHAKLLKAIIGAPELKQAFADTHLTTRNIRDGLRAVYKDACSETIWRWRDVSLLRTLHPLPSRGASSHGRTGAVGRPLCTRATPLSGRPASSCARALPRRSAAKGPLAHSGAVPVRYAARRRVGGRC